MAHGKVNYVEGGFAKTVYQEYENGEALSEAHKKMESFFRKDYLVHWVICTMAGTDPDPVVDRAIREHLQALAMLKK
jgi:hypothetical protein